MINQKIKDRNLPELLKANDGTIIHTPEQWMKRRTELLNTLSSEVYGFTPESPASVTVRITETRNAFAGKAVWETLSLSFETPEGIFSFPFALILPAREKQSPVFLSISFRKEIPDLYLPAEEIIDNGYGIAMFCYQDVTSDGPEWDGIAAMYPRDPQSGWGKIGMWAFAASRVMDYLETRSEVDASQVCVAGHSRLGKTALWCSAQDERFAMAVSNNSGCSGAAITRGKVGETIDDITQRFPYWFCGKYQQWRKREWEMPFEQHMLLSLTAPRKLYVCSAVEDEWADPESEFLACTAATDAWQIFSLPGLITPNHLPEADQPLHDGNIGYHLRTGTHFWSRTDWLYQIAFRNRHHV